MTHITISDFGKEGVRKRAEEEKRRRIEEKREDVTFRREVEVPAPGGDGEEARHGAPRQQAEKTEFHAKKDNFDIEDMVRRIQEERDICRISELEIKYEDFAKAYFPLFQKAYHQTWTDEDWAGLRHMLRLREMVKQGKTHYHEASAGISRHFAEIHQPELLRTKQVRKMRKKLEKK